jgi:hypothetical protein
MILRPDREEGGGNSQKGGITPSLGQLIFLRFESEADE